MASFRPYKVNSLLFYSLLPSIIWLFSLKQKQLSTMKLKSQELSQHSMLGCTPPLNLRKFIRLKVFHLSVSLVSLNKMCFKRQSFFNGKLVLVIRNFGLRYEQAYLISLKVSENTNIVFEKKVSEFSFWFDFWDLFHHCLLLLNCFKGTHFYI